MYQWCQCHCYYNSCSRQLSNAAADVSSGAGEEVMYKDPDSLATAGRARGYELTQCPAYATSQPQTQVQSSASDDDNL